MRYAETGYKLEVDLSRGNIEKVETDPGITEQYLGGQGTAVKELWDRVPPEVEPFSPDNLLIFSTGLLTATPVCGANRTVVNSFAPQTNNYLHSVLGGYWGPELKQAGYDRLVISGKSPELVYLWINNDKVEIRDAAHLKGKGANETAGILKKELNDQDVQVVAIGLAGENRVYFASIEHGSSSAARGGAGAIMGDKKLKAIAVRGTKELNVAYPQELFETYLRLTKEIYENPATGDTMADTFTDTFHHDNFSWGNARVRRKNFWSEEYEEKYVNYTEENLLRWTGCFNCPKHCHLLMSWPGRKNNFVKCFGRATYHMAAFKEHDFSYEITPVALEYGFDSYSTPQVMAFAIELYKVGILTDSDLPNFPSDVKDRFYYLLDIIARRDGIGDVLANGVYWAARQIGKGAEKYDHNTVKKFEQVPLKLGKLNPPYFLMTATGEKMNVPQIEGSFPQDPLPTREEREEFVSGWEAAPNERMKEIFLEWEKKYDVTNEESCMIVDWNEIMHYVDDAVGLCAFVSSFRGGQFGGRPPYHIHNIPDFIKLAHGLELDKDGLWEIAARNRNLVRALNVRRGLRRKDEKPPEDHWAVRDHEFEQKLLDDYYEFKGWTIDGIPRKDTLHELGLDYVSDDLIKRGILTGDELPPSQEKQKQEAQKAGGASRER